MHILDGVGKAMVIAMMGRPPQRPSLQSGRAQPCQHELKGAAGAKRAVGKVAMEAAGDSKGAHEISNDERDGGRPADAGPEHERTARMEQQKTPRAEYPEIHRGARTAG